MQHHEAALARFVTRAQADPTSRGVLLTGSVARGEERADSDVDVVLVVTDEAWARAVAEDRVMYVLPEDADYEGGYLDVKLATVELLHAIPGRGDQPALSSLASARCAWDQGFDLEEALAAIRLRAARPDPELAAAFVAQARLHGEWFLQEGIRLGDPVLTAHAAVHLAVAAGRVLLALAGTPYPGPKQLLPTLRALPTATDGDADALVEVVEHPSAASCAAVLGVVERTAGHLLHPDLALSRFVLDNEYAWFTGRQPPEYR